MTSIHIPIEWELIMFINIRVLLLCSTDWKSSLNIIIQLLEVLFIMDSGIPFTFSAIEQLASTGRHNSLN